VSYIRSLHVINDSGLFGTNFSIGPLPLLFTAEDTPPDTYLASQQSVSIEPRLNGTAMNGALTWQAGLYYEMSFPQGLSGSSGPNLISCSNFQTLQCFDLAAQLFGLPAGSIGSVGRRTGTITWRDYGSYAQDTYAFTDQLSLTTGLRYSYDLTTSETNRYVYAFRHRMTRCGSASRRSRTSATARWMTDRSPARPPAWPICSTSPTRIC